jgi:hypothetical protein
VQIRLHLRYTPIRFGVLIITLGNNQSFQSEEKSE